MSVPSGSNARKPFASYKALAMRVLAVIIILGAALFAVFQLDGGNSIPAAMGRKPLDTAAAGSSQPSADEQTAELILGTWQDDYQGRRTLTVRPDGTATMLIEFDGWKARMFTPRLRIETTWSIQEGRFNRQTVGGEPADKVEFVKKRVGDRASDKIVKVTAERMVLVDQDGETRYNWRRVR
jgi:hypothetical protein